MPVRPRKYDRPISVEEARSCREELLTLKERAKYIGNAEHKKSAHHDFGCTPKSQLKRGKTCCDAVNIFELKTAISLLRQGFEKGLVSPSEPGNEWPKRVWAVSKNGEVLEGRHSGGGQYHGFPVLDNSAIETIIRQRWNMPDE
jgi:hypothetical protein